eukprot:scaffold4062_cov137-Cylindrotheca_fusiformis.AAC.9
MQKFDMTNAMTAETIAPNIQSKFIFSILNFRSSSMLRMESTCGDICPTKYISILIFRYSSTLRAEVWSWRSNACNDFIVLIKIYPCIQTTCG